ncbi:MAG: hypothetical protein R6V18_05260 [Desulfuromonadaceae bacterium]
MKRVLLTLVSILALATPALAVDFSFHGDLKHEFRINSNQSGFTGGKEFGSKLSQNQTSIYDDDVNETFGLIKYRMWTEAASDNGAVKGVYAIEVGGIHFGDDGKGGAFSGDEVNIETRWAYTDFALGGGRMKVGLQPVKINKFFWNETATGINYKKGDFEAAWYRGYEVVNDDGDGNDFQDLDALYVRYNLKPANDIKVGLFGVWQTSDADTLNDLGGSMDVNDLTWKVKKLTDFDIDLYTLGIDGGMKAGNFFANWDLMYQTGDFLEEVDFGGYFAHFDLGTKLGSNGKLTYTFWYASGDDDRTDGDFDAFIVTDIDVKADFSSVVLYQGLNSDQYFTTDPYIQDKGMMMNRLAYDTKVSDKLKVGVAAMYMMTAEDMEYDDELGNAYADDSIGFEVDAYAKYKLYDSLEIALAAGYLMSGDALDFYEESQDGSADEDIYVVTSRIRYKF